MSAVYPVTIDAAQGLAYSVVGVPFAEGVLTPEQEAEKAVAKIHTASDYHKRIVHDFVLREARAGRWDEMAHLYLLMLDIDNSPTDLKGYSNGSYNWFTSGGITGVKPTHIAWGGTFIGNMAYMNVPVNISEEWASRSDYQICFSIAEIVPNGSIDPNQPNVVFGAGSFYVGPQSSSSLLWADNNSTYGAAAEVAFGGGFASSDITYFDDQITRLQAMPDVNNLAWELQNYGDVTNNILGWAANTENRPKKFQVGAFQQGSTFLPRGEVTHKMYALANEAMDFDSFAASMEEAIEEFENNPADDADAAVARLVSPSQFVEDTVWQYVYNLSFAGQWKNVTNLAIFKTNEASSVKDLTGNAADIDMTNAGTTYLSQNGWRLSKTEYMVMPWDTQLASPTSERDYQFGFALTNPDFNLSQANNLLIMGAYDATYNSSAIFYNPNSAKWGYAVSCRFGAAEDPVSTEADITGSLVAARGIVGSQDINIVNGRGAFTIATSSVDSAAVNSAFMGLGNAVDQTGTQVSVGTAGFDAQFAYLGNGKLDMDVFTRETERMLSELSNTAPLMTYPIQEGDSLQLDNAGFGYFGWVTAMAEVQAADRFDYSSGGRTLKQVAQGGGGSGAFLAHIASNPTADSAIIGAGINDIITDGDSIATIKNYASQLVSQFVAAENLKTLLVKQITPIKGRLNSQEFPLEQQNKWQPYINELNAHLKDLCDSTEGAFLLEAYETTESSSAAYRDYQEGLVKGVPPAANTTTNGTKGDLTVDGVHYTAAGADLIAAQADALVRDIRYYKP